MARQAGGKQKGERGTLFRKAFSDTVPVMAGYLVLGTAFGILLRTNGFRFLAAPAMSVLIYAGSMQFVAIPLICEGASLLTIALTTFLVNARHLFYGISMTERYRNAGRIRPYLIFGLTDETYSLVCEPGSGIPEEQTNRYCFLVTLLDQIYWVTGSALGYLVGSVLPFDTRGIDFALTALFISVATEQWLKSRNHVSAVVGFGASLVSLLLFGRDGFLIPAMVMIAVTLLVMNRTGKEGGGDD